MSEKDKSCIHDENDKPPKIPICYFCEKVVTEDDYCSGCKHYVCQDCSLVDVFGEHSVDEHQEEEEEF
jgi:hypothetical protein